MSDASGQGEQQSGTTIATTTGDKWGEPISPERQAELQGYLDQWHRVPSAGSSPYRCVSQRHYAIVVPGSQHGVPVP